MSNSVYPTDQNQEQQHLLEKDGIIYHFLKRVHVEELHPIMATAFLEEPVAVMIGANKLEFTKLLFDFQFKQGLVVDNGLSVVAIDATNGKIVGGFTVMDGEDLSAFPGGCGAKCQLMSIAYKMYSDFPRAAELDEVMNQLNVNLNKEIEQITKKNKLKTKKGVVCEMLAVGVHKDYSGRGIGKELTNLALQNSKNKGFCISKAECSSLYSTKALLKNGGVVEHTVDYETFTLQGGCCSGNTMPFKGSVSDIHKNANLVVFRHFPEGIQQVEMPPQKSPEKA